MTRIGSVLLEKLDQLATIAVEGRTLYAEGDREPVSPAALVEQAVNLARAVARGRPLRLLAAPLSGRAKCRQAN